MNLILIIGWLDPIEFESNLKQKNKQQGKAENLRNLFSTKSFFNRLMEKQTGKQKSAPSSI